MSTELTVPGSSSILNKKIRSSDLILTVLIDLAAAFSILLLIAIMGYVFFRGLPQISLSFLTSVPSTIKGTFGIAGNIVNTLYIIILTLLIATPIGVGSAIYLNEYAKPGKIVRLIEFTTETLSGIITGIILAIGRIVGESAALLFTAGSGYLLPKTFAGFFKKIFESGGTLTIQLYLSMSKAQYDAAFGIAAVLLIIVLFINLLTKILAKKFDVSKLD